MQKENRKMRKFAVVLLVVGFTHVSAFGGIVTFSPDKPTVDLNVDPFVTLDVFVDQLVGVNNSFQSIDILLGSNGLDLVSFTFDPGLVFAFSEVTPNPGFGVYASEIKLGGFAIGPIAVAGPTLVGSLVVRGLEASIDNFSVIVDGFNDGDRSVAVLGAVRDPLVGTGFVNVIPEPATITLLALASLALVRRRRKA